jgi:uncharacterized membrane protein YgcG
MGNTVSISRCQSKHLSVDRKQKYSTRETIITADNYRICNVCYNALPTCVKCNKRMVRKFYTQERSYLDTQIKYGKYHCKDCFTQQGLTMVLKTKYNRHYYDHSSDSSICDAGSSFDSGGGDCGGGDGGSCD